MGRNGGVGAGAAGAQAREGDAPSWFNAVEAAAVADLVAGLLSHPGVAAGGITPDSIGVMCTYRKQARRKEPPKNLPPKNPQNNDIWWGAS